MSIQSSFNTALTAGAYFARQSPLYEGKMADYANKQMHKYGTTVADPQAAESLREATRRNYYTMIKSGMKGAINSLNAYNADIAVSDQQRAAEEQRVAEAEAVEQERREQYEREQEEREKQEGHYWDAEPPRPKTADYSQELRAVTHRVEDRLAGDAEQIRSRLGAHPKAYNNRIQGKGGK